jgi:D-glycero-alpha-D-manno-heptose 1-phosphate guanylyltransferase
MAPVRGRPFLALILDRLVRAGFGAVVLAVGYRSEAIRSYFGDSYCGVPLRYSVESEPLGTGGAIRLAYQLTDAPDMFVVNGDTYLDLDYRAMLDAHQRADALLTIAVCSVPDAGRYGALELTDEKVTGVCEKGRSGPGWINAGVYILARRIQEYFPCQATFSFEQDLLVPQVRVLEPRAYAAEGLFIDIGVPEDYARAQTLLPSGQQ